MISSTGTAIALGSHAQANFSLTLLNLGPPEQSALGTAFLLQTADHRTALIDGGPDAALLASTLDSLLPFWQRSLDMLLLTTPRGNHLTGLQDVSNRFQVAFTLDAGMLHPSAAYALWRQSLVDHGQHYQRLHQGNTLMLGPQLAFQVFWPPSLLHKSADETHDNALVLKIITPGLQLLLLGDAALSRYALAGLLANIAPTDLQSNIVMITDDSSKSLPASLDQLLQLARPNLLLITPATPNALGSVRQSHQQILTL